MNGIAQIIQAQTRIHNALVDLQRFDLDDFTESEVKLRLEAVINVALIAQSDLGSMKKDWIEHAQSSS